MIYGSVGKGRSATTVHGGGKFVWPVIQDFDYLSLEPMQIEVPLKDALSSEKLEAEAEAAMIYAKLEAEAGGQYEILARKGLRGEKPANFRLLDQPGTG